MGRKGGLRDGLQKGVGTTLPNQKTDTTSLSPYSEVQIQSAKDFIWEYMDDGNRELIIGMATLSTHERHGLYVKKIECGLEMTSSGVKKTERERMIIGLQYNRQPSPSSQTT